MELLVKKKVYPFVEESEMDFDDYGTMLGDEARKAELIEINNMKKKIKSLDDELGDLKFDRE